MPKIRDYKNPIKFCALNRVSTINGEKGGAVGFDNFVWVRKEDFNNIIWLRRDTPSTGFGEKDKFVEVLQDNFFKGFCTQVSFGLAHL